MDYLIGTDIGTSGTKTVLMDLRGNLIAQELVTYDLLTPRPLWAEQWPEVWLSAAKRSIRRTVERAGVPANRVRGLCISGLYGGSGVPLDREMRPVRPCIIWMDRRAEEESRWVREHIPEKRLRRITHNGTDPYYGYLKQLWIKRHEPENWEKIKLFLPPNAYVIYCLTGEVAIDYSSAGNLGGVFDMERRAWSEEMLEALGIPRSMMPERLVASSEVVGPLRAEAARELGLPAGMPVCAGGVDCGVAAFGLGVFEPGEYVAAVGTSMCAALIHDRPIPAEGLIEWPYVLDPLRLSYSFGGGATAGAVVKWFRDTFAAEEREAECAGGESAYAALDRAASEIPPGSGGLVVLPYFMGERSPLWDTDAKGVIFGLSLSHTRAHIYRAFLEAVAYSLRHTVEAAGECAGDYILLAGGLSRSPLWRQIFADVTGYPVVCPLCDVEANLGDVMLAGLGTGCLTLEELRGWRTRAEPVRPNPEASAVYDRYYRIYRALYGDLKGEMRELSRLQN